MKINNTTLALADGTTSMVLASDFTTAPQQLLQTLAFSIEAVYTGDSMAGTLKVQASNTYNPTTHADGTWVDISGATTSISGAGSGMFNFGNGVPGYNYCRVVWTNSSSSGNARMTLTANVKGF